MPSEWVDRVFCFIPVGQRVAANSRWSTTSRNHDVGDATTWDRAVECSAAAAPNPPATYLGINTMLKESDRQAYLDDALPGQSNFFQSDGWNWNTALADMNLGVIVTPP